ncbi:dienelactone hydrolase family protein [Streptosporangium sp. NPDC000396]|uniref:dienelactone hydrolase family protein n=1 Tax=Streptosporangium sp. NPDC000396 TaxID=3366185 RepID=UPI00369ABE85
MAERLPDDHDTAIVVAHEIYGVNEHIAGVAQALRRYRCDVFAPDLRPAPTAYTRDQESQAYQDFMLQLGVEGMGQALRRYVRELRGGYRRVQCVGFSVGATAAWLAAGAGVLDGTVCFYGSRIRDHLDARPAGGCLVVIAEREASFSGRVLADRLADRDEVVTRLYDCAHGFCDPGNPHYSAEHSQEAWSQAVDFLGLSAVGE